MLAAETDGGGILRVGGEGDGHRGLYWPPRTKEGAVLIPSIEDGDAEGTDKPLTLEEELQRLDVLAVMLSIPAEKVTELREQLTKKYEAVNGTA